MSLNFSATGTPFAIHARLCSSCVVLEQKRCQGLSDASSWWYRLVVEMGISCVPSDHLQMQRASQLLTCNEALFHSNPAYSYELCIPVAVDLYYFGLGDYLDMV